MIELHNLTEDHAARRRAAKVMPNGVYGHQSAISLLDGFPQFIQRTEGCRVWDLDGNEYIDFMCGYGIVLLGYHHPVVDAAIERQMRLADCSNGPGVVMVELAELLVETVDHADWAIFAKNGTDATTTDRPGLYNYRGRPAGVAGRNPQTGNNQPAPARLGAGRSFAHGNGGAGPAQPGPERGPARTVE